jgi:hypothetical protein
MSDDRPDFFEQEASAELMHLVRAASQYVLAFLAHRNASLRRATEWSDELWLGVHVALESLFVWRRGATVGDAMCALRRRRGHRLSLALLVALNTLGPYVLRRLAAAHEHALSEVNNSSNSNVQWSIRNLFVRFYPSVRSALLLLALALQMTYAFSDRMRVFSIADWLADAVAVRVSPQELAAHEAARVAARSARLGAVSLRRPLRSSGALLTQWCLDGVDATSSLIAPLVTAYRFVEWWYANESALMAGSVFVPPPPPSAPALADADTALLLRDRQLCPLCRQPRRNATVALTSGIVYCYRCIYEHVKVHHECPITRRPLRADQIAKVFVD